MFRNSESQGQGISWYVVNLTCTLVWAILLEIFGQTFGGCFCGGVCVSVCVEEEKKQISSAPVI